MPLIELCATCIGTTSACPFHPEECPDFVAMGPSDPAEAALPQYTDDWLLPYCACGRRWSQCDGSRAACPRRRVAP